MQIRNCTVFTRLTLAEREAYIEAAEKLAERPSVLLREAVKRIVKRAGVEWPKRSDLPKDAGGDWPKDESK